MSSNIGVNWRTAWNLLHSKQKAERLVSIVCQFITDKLNHIRDNMSNSQKSSALRSFAVGQHHGQELSSFQPVTIREVHKLLSLIKSSLLGALPCSLLKSCADVFASTIARLANLSTQSGNFPARYKRALVMPLLDKTGLDSSSSDVDVHGPPQCSTLCVLQQLYWMEPRYPNVQGVVLPVL